MRFLGLKKLLSRNGSRVMRSQRGQPSLRSGARTGGLVADLLHRIRTVGVVKQMQAALILLRTAMLAANPWMLIKVRTGRARDCSACLGRLCCQQINLRSRGDLRRGFRYIP